MSRRKVYIVTIIATIAVLLLYFYKFHIGLSDSQSDWGNFATFVTGLITPLLAFLNILVFIDLTRSIESDRQKSEEDKQAEEKRRHDQELQHQKEMMMLQLRVDEINKLDQAIGDALTPSNITYKDNVPHPVIYALMYVNSFMNSKLQLFEFDSDLQRVEFERHFIKLHNILGEYCKKFKDPNTELKGSDLQGFIDERFDIIKNLFAIALNKEVKWLDKLI